MRTEWQQRQLHCQLRVFSIEDEPLQILIASQILSVKDNRKVVALAIGGHVGDADWGGVGVRRRVLSLNGYEDAILVTRVGFRGVVEVATVATDATSTASPACCRVRGAQPLVAAPADRFQGVLKKNSGQIAAAELMLFRRKYTSKACQHIVIALHAEISLQLAPVGALRR